MSTSRTPEDTVPLARVERLARLARTVRGLHPLQVLARPHRLVLDRLVRRSSAALPPRVRPHFPPAPAASIAFAGSERERARERVPRLASSPALLAFERAYGLELGAEGCPPMESWRTAAGSHPYPASVRARRLAVAARLGAPGLDGELARAARSVALQPELHLMANHLLENGIGLACAGAVTQGPEADLWWSLGCTILRWQLDAQFYPDGGHVEGSATYHLALTAALLEAIELAEASGRQAPASWRLVAVRALQWAALVRSPDGGYPLFNDASLDAGPSADAVLALGHGVMDGMDLQPDLAASVCTLASTGWVILRQPDAWLAIKAGPDGDPIQPGHVHADLLSFELWIQGLRTVVDHGVASYSSGARREASRATRSHNTIEVAGVDTSEVWSAFRVGRRARGEILGSGTTADGAWAEVQHNGYRDLPGGPVPRRRVALTRGRLTVTDSVLHGTAPAVSRLRLDAAVARTVTVRPGASGVQLTPQPGEWFPRYADPRAATVFSQSMPPGSTCQWVLDWQSPEIRCAS